MTGGVDLDVDGGDSALDDSMDTEPMTPSPDRVERVADHLDGNAEIDQRAEQHIAGCAARAVDVEVLTARILGGRRLLLLARERSTRHRDAGDRAAAGTFVATHGRTASLAIFTAATAAPTPLSMLTTEMPGAHADSSAPSATRPSIETP